MSTDLVFNLIYIIKPTKISTNSNTIITNSIGCMFILVFLIFLELIIFLMLYKQYDITNQKAREYTSILRYNKYSARGLRVYF
jgi:hypothetical protein